MNNFEKSKLLNYQIGFIGSIVLTLIAYNLVVHHILIGTSLAIAIFLLALTQVAVQLIYFLHIDKGWKSSVLFSTIGLILIVIGASLWIMNDLKYRHGPPDNVDQTIINEEGIGK